MGKAISGEGRELVPPTRLLTTRAAWETGGLRSGHDRQQIMSTMKTKTFITRALGAIAVVGLLLCVLGHAADSARDSTGSTTNSSTAPHSILTPAPETQNVTTGLSTGERQAKDVARKPESHRDTDAPKEASSTSNSDTNGANWLLSKAALRGTITGGVDPHGNSWTSIQNSFEQFAHPAFVLRLFLSLTLSVACAAMIAWHPWRRKRLNTLSDLEERKAFIILGVAGAIIAELSGTSPTLAFVIFGVGALLRFRTVLDNPKATGKAILVVVIGLACGMGSWTMAVFVTVFSWFLLFWLDSKVTCNMTIRVDANGDSKPLQHAVQSLLVAHHCRIQGCKFSKSRKRMEFLFNMPAKGDQEQLEADIRARLPKNGDSRVSIEVI